jgi:hypothetical protein
MSATHHQPAAHSAIVHMQLSVNGCVLPIAQMGPNFLVLKAPIDHPPAEAEIAMWIDGHEDRWRVHLPEGINSVQRRTAISKIPEFNGSAVE